MRTIKSDIRRKIIALRKKNHLKKRTFNFKLIYDLIKKRFSNRKTIVAGYYPSNYEVDILNFIKLISDKRYKIALPVIEPKNNMTFRLWKYKEPLNVNNFGILEPQKNKNKVLPDIILVPLVAFDSKRNRIGYGKGYYDRCLKKIKNIKRNMISIGIAYSFQQCKNIPVNKYDHKLDYIFTERGIIHSKY